MSAFLAARVASALPSMPNSLIEIVVGYYRISDFQKSFRRDKSVFAGDEPIQATLTAFAMRQNDGSVVTWGPATSGGDCSSVQAKLKNVKALRGSYAVFAAIAGDDDTVVCWGDKAYGGDCSAVEGELRQVEALCSTRGAFAALKRDGTVVTWGNNGFFHPWWCVIDDE